MVGRKAQWLGRKDAPKVDSFQYPHLFYFLCQHPSPKAYPLRLQHLMYPQHLQRTDKKWFTWWIGLRNMTLSLTVSHQS